MTDPIGNRGFAVVLPRTNSYSTLARAIDKKREFDAQMDQKRQEQSAKWFDNNSKLNWENVDYSIQQPLSELFTATYAGMNQLYKQANGNLDPNSQSQILGLKNDFDVAQKLSKGYSDEIRELNDVIKNDKYGRYNKGYVAQQLKNNTEQVWTKDESGLPSWNNEARSPMEILSDPKAINEQGLVNEWLDNLADVETSVTNDAGLYTTTDNYKFKSSLYEVGKDGTPVVDPNTGRAIPKASAANIAIWDQDPDRQRQLDIRAQEITPEGKDWRSYRADAFKKYFIEPYAPVSKTSKGGRDYKPEFIVNPKEKELDVDTVYPIISAIVDDKDPKALQQLSVGNSDFKVEFAGQNLGPFNQAKGDPTEIVIYQLQPVERSILGKIDNMNSSTVKKEWVIYDRIPLDDKEVAFSKLTQVFDKTNATKLSQGLFNKRKKAAPKVSEADEFGLN